MRRYVASLPRHFSADEVIRFWLHPLTRPHMRLYTNIDAEILSLALNSCITAVKSKPVPGANVQMKFVAFAATCAAGMGYELDQLSDTIKILFRIVYLDWKMKSGVWEMVKSVNEYVDLISFDEVKDNGEIDVLKSVGYSPPTFPLALSLRSLEHNQLKLRFQRTNE